MALSAMPLGALELCALGLFWFELFWWGAVGPCLLRASARGGVWIFLCLGQLGLDVLFVWI